MSTESLVHYLTNLHERAAANPGRRAIVTLDVARAALEHAKELAAQLVMATVERDALLDAALTKSSDWATPAAPIVDTGIPRVLPSVESDRAAIISFLRDCQRTSAAGDADAARFGEAADLLTVPPRPQVPEGSEVQTAMGPEVQWFPFGAEVDVSLARGTVEVYSDGDAGRLTPDEAELLAETVLAAARKARSC